MKNPPRRATAATGCDDATTTSKTLRRRSGSSGSIYRVRGSNTTVSPGAQATVGHEPSRQLTRIPDQSELCQFRSSRRQQLQVSVSAPSRVRTTYPYSWQPYNTHGPRQISSPRSEYSIPISPHRLMCDHPYFAFNLLTLPGADCRL